MATEEETEERHRTETKTLICALNLLSRDLPLPPHLISSVSSIYHNDDDTGNSKEDLLTDLEDALGSKLEEASKNRYQSRIQHRLNELEELPSSRGEDLQTKCLLELYGLKVLKTRDYIHVEQMKFVVNIILKPRMKLVKSDF